MDCTSYQLAGVLVLEFAPEGSVLREDRETTRLISAAMEHGADIVAIPAARLAADFFDLSNGVAGAFTQKFVNYRLRLAFMGDFSAAIDASGALAAYAREANRGGDIWFVADRLDLERRLSGPPH